ncbi:DUF4253 domain-containing protein [Streptomyces sp. NPDC015127]|uniref:DUF4253 domain-containing protein n=1 Tax=Streptomyces sp. NPDC015127 TaxID=3364939 RepID=UPI0036FE9ADA
MRARDRTGWQSVLLVDDELRSIPWDRAIDVGPDRREDADGHDAAEVLAALWDCVQAEDAGDLDDEDDEDMLAPFTRAWPGLASSRSIPRDPDAVAVRVAAGLLRDAWPRGARGALVPARRSADILTSLGWIGACNHADTGPLTAVLRSWEDRFRTRLVAVHFDRVDLSVARPPRTTKEALAVAAEHHAFCPDNVRQGYETIRAYARHLVGREHWTFWRD